MPTSSSEEFFTKSEEIISFSGIFLMFSDLICIGIEENIRESGY